MSNVMTHPEWHPEQNPEYDSLLKAPSATELSTLLSGDVSAAKAFMLDTRRVHQKLYAPLTPPGYQEYAGTYRGTKGTTLQDRRIHAQAVTKEGVIEFINPEKVSAFLDNHFKEAVDQLLCAPSTDSPDQLFGRAAKVFYIFGLIHPYLNGNGHIQRLLFAAAVAQHSQLELLPSWTIHPRPYDIEMARAFEQTPGALGAVTKVLSPYVKR